MAEIGGNSERKTSSFKLHFCTKFFHNPPSNQVAHQRNQTPKTPAGWKSMPYIFGNEIFATLATVGMSSNFMVYFMTVFNLSIVSATNMINIWTGVTNFAPLVGGFLADAYVGKFKTIALASCVGFLGMLVVTLTAWLHDLHPAKCNLLQQSQHCKTPNSLQFGVLILGLGLLSIGTGGIKPCNIPFGIDQFDQTTEQGIENVQSYYNWYFTVNTTVLLISLTLIVYIQGSVSWVLGFAIPTVLMLCSIILFFVGMKIYVYATPEGSIFSEIFQVFVAAYRKRTLKLPGNAYGNDIQLKVTLYDPPAKESTLSKLPLTDQFRFLNKASIIEEGDLSPDKTCINKWKMCSIQQIEEVKCILKCIPILASSIISNTSIVQQGTFVVAQAMIMDRHLGKNFQIPPASVSIISLIVVIIWLPFYDRLLVPTLRKTTKHAGGVTQLQRIGIGIILSVIFMMVAGLTERKRRIAALDGGSLSVFWLTPQLVFLGFCEAFNSIGQIDFLNKEFPDNMKCMANSLYWCTLALSSYISSLMITLVQRFSRTEGHPGWLTNDLNKGRLDCFYFVFAGMGVLNFIYFIFCAQKYKYKLTVVIPTEDDIELKSNT